jgi:uncharacterized protein (DUF1330 family)
MLIVAILTVKTDAAASFHAFEKIAVSIMARHGGTLERTVVVLPGPGESVFREVHVLRFPDAAAFAAYKADPEMAKALPLRNAAVVQTEILAGEEGPLYGG